MSTCKSDSQSRQRFACPRLNLGFAALLAFVAVGFVASAGAGAMQEFGANDGSAPLAPAGFTFVVNRTGDANGVGLTSRCDTDILTIGDQCTLRAALRATNATAAEDTITFNIPITQPGCDSATGKCVINLTQALPNITEGVSIIGPGADKLTVRRDTGGDYRIFTVTQSATHVTTISGLTITGGNVINGQVGGGISNESAGILSVQSCVVTGNVAAGGGGIANGVNSSETDIYNSLISNNSADGTSGLNGGGGVLAITGAVNITNSVIFQNSVPSTFGGGVRNISATLNISNSTIARNRASFSGRGGGVYGPATVKSTIIAQNFVSSSDNNDVEGIFTSAGFNLIGQLNGSAGFDQQPTDQTGGAVDAPLDPRLGDVMLFGALVRVQPLCTSPALDKGSSVALNGALTTDIRGTGFPRTIDDPIGNATGGDATDIGALERPACSRTEFTFTVNKTGDFEDFNLGDHVCDSDLGAAGAQCTLRAAMQEANLTGEENPAQALPSSVINFSIPLSEPFCDGATGACVIHTTKELPPVAVGMTIQGPGADRLTVRRFSGGQYRIFTITSPSDVTISGLTISNGSSTDFGGGGGIALISKITLNVISCQIVNNYAERFGGGISSGAGTLNVSDSTISNNVTDGEFNAGGTAGGGGIAFFGHFNAGVLTVNNSTISNNVSKTHGGGILTARGISVSISGTRFIANAANVDSPLNEGRGGGLAISTNKSSFSTFNVMNCQFIGNRAKRGGGANFGFLGLGTTTV
ncbi:MAG: hypothetical protein M3R52_00400, partial [Acidobacteriota bacterium]|nr:hypothetical protein [Acidobacteriota bacterium]